MDWFLYGNTSGHERVNDKNMVNGERDDYVV